MNFLNIIVTLENKEANTLSNSKIDKNLKESNLGFNLFVRNIYILLIFLF